MLGSRSWRMQYENWFTGEKARKHWYWGEVQYLLCFYSALPSALTPHWPSPTPPTLLARSPIHPHPLLSHSWLTPHSSSPSSLVFLTSLLPSCTSVLRRLKRRSRRQSVLEVSWNSKKGQHYTCVLWRPLQCTCFIMTSGSSTRQWRCCRVTLRLLRMRGTHSSTRLRLSPMLPFLLTYQEHVARAHWVVGLLNIHVYVHVVNHRLYSTHQN